MPLLLALRVAPSSLAAVLAMGAGRAHSGGACATADSSTRKGVAVYRHHYRCEVRYGDLRQFVDLSRAISDLERQRGWAVSSVWTPVVGTANEVIVIAEYESLAAFEQERSARRADAEYLRLSRQAEELMAPGTFRDELLEEPPARG